MTADLKRVEVYHAKVPTFGFKPLPKWPGDYIRVAMLEAECRKNTVCADYAFHITNSITEPWFESRNLFVWLINGPLRSTSVGDIITVNDIAYLCDMVGWKKIS